MLFVDTLLLIKAAIMGVVEGLTEFLPISSTGHLILTGSLLGMTDERDKVFEVAIQTGAIFAVILVYWQKIRATLCGLGKVESAKLSVTALDNLLDELGDFQRLLAGSLRVLEQRNIIIRSSMQDILALR